MVTQNDNTAMAIVGQRAASSPPRKVPIPTGMTS
jgi:hypothetical protein